MSIKKSSLIEMCYSFICIIRCNCCGDSVLQYRVSDWKEFLMHKLVGANTLQPCFHVKANANFQRCPLRPGMWLEVVDRTCLAVMTVATVDKIVGSRVRLRYLQSEVNNRCGDDDDIHISKLP